LHCLERDIAERVHAKVQREIGEHGETSCEAEPPDRHLVAENVGIYHLTPSPGRDAASYHPPSVFWKGANVNPSMSGWGQKPSSLPRKSTSDLPPTTDITRQSGHFRKVPKADEPKAVNLLA